MTSPGELLVLLDQQEYPRKTLALAIARLCEPNIGDGDRELFHQVVNGNKLDIARSRIGELQAQIETAPTDDDITALSSTESALRSAVAAAEGDVWSALHACLFAEDIHTGQRGITRARDLCAVIETFR